MLSCSRVKFDPLLRYLWLFCALSLLLCACAPPVLVPSVEPVIVPDRTEYILDEDSISMRDGNGCWHMYGLGEERLEFLMTLCEK